MVQWDAVCMTTVVLSSLLTEAPSNVFCKRKRDAGTHAVMKQGWSHCFARADMHSCFTENAGPSVDTSKRFCHAVLLALAGGPRAGGSGWRRGSWWRRRWRARGSTSPRCRRTPSSSAAWRATRHAPRATPTRARPVFFRALLFLSLGRHLGSAATT